MDTSTQSPPAGAATSTRPGRLNPAYWFIAPALTLIAVFFFLPVAGALLLSFTDFDIYALGNPDNLRFVGLANYGRLLQDPLFWTALRNTLYLVLVGGPEPA